MSPERWRQVEEVFNAVLERAPGDRLSQQNKSLISRNIHFAFGRHLADPTRAIESFNWAVAETARRYGSWDVAWGNVHRVRRGSVDVPVGGCASSLGCFRALAFTREPDGKLAASGGDGWVLAVEFGEVPRAVSVLAYGESPRRESPWFADQAEMFAKGQLKKVAFTTAEVDAQAVVRYRPGEK
jgi:acyl-homoserine-lactone acylase